MTNPERWRGLSRSLDKAMEGLTAFDAEGLERLEEQLRTLPAEYRTQGLAESREMLTELLRKHTLLQAMLQATAANLKVLEPRRTNALDRREETHGYFDLTAEPVAQRAYGGSGGAERDRK